MFHGTDYQITSLNKQHLAFFLISSYFYNSVEQYNIIITCCRKISSPRVLLTLHVPSGKKCRLSRYSFLRARAHSYVLLIVFHNSFRFWVLRSWKARHIFSVLPSTFFVFFFSSNHIIFFFNNSPKRYALLLVFQYNYCLQCCIIIVFFSNLPRVFFSKSVYFISRKHEPNYVKIFYVYLHII